MEFTKTERDYLLLCRLGVSFNELADAIEGCGLLDRVREEAIVAYRAKVAENARLYQVALGNRRRDETDSTSIDEARAALGADILAEQREWNRRREAEREANT